MNKMPDSVLVIKIKHCADLSKELKKAIQVANYAIKNKNFLSTKYVAEIGLPSEVSCQILRKYGKNKKCKSINEDKVKLVVPGRAVKINNNQIRVVPLKLIFTNNSKHQINKVCQIELDSVYAYISFKQPNAKPLETNSFIGVDLNATSHCAVVANPKNGKVIKLGKQAPHIHKKYKALRTNLQKQKLYKKLKQTKGKESNKVKDLNHKISKKIVRFAKENNCGIKLEKLTGIRKNKKTNKSFRHTLNSWSYYQLGIMIAYKALLQGIPVQYINPSFTSQNCSRCGNLGKRNGKVFKCANCNHTGHSDVNASFNIAKSLSLITATEKKIGGNGGTDMPMGQSNKNTGTSKTLLF